MNAELLIQSEQYVWPEKVVTDWRRFSSGLWRVAEGDISAAYCAETFPKIKVFTHEGRLFTNCGGHFSGPVPAGADCYPLIPVAEYAGPEPRRYTYEGREACYRNEVVRLGPKVAFLASDATLEEWRAVLRAMYADGGWFARQANYGSFLNENSNLAKSPNGTKALQMEQAGNLVTLSKQEIQQSLDATSPSLASDNQLDLSL